MGSERKISCPLWGINRKAQVEHYLVRSRLRPERRLGLVKRIGHAAVRAVRRCAAKERAPARFCTSGIAARLSAAFALAVTCAAVSDMRQSGRSRQAGLWTAKLCRLRVPRRPERRLGIVEAIGYPAARAGAPGVR